MTKRGEGKLPARLPRRAGGSYIRPMHRNARILSLSFLLACSSVVAQAPPTAPEQTPAPQVDAVAKRLDEVNAKLDALSQQILKIEQHLANQRPGVMIGEKEPAPAPAAPTSAAAPVVAPAPGNANAHTVAKGETLTAIAKQYKVTVEELQKFNHIEDGRKLQAGQTLQIPMPGSAAPSASPSASPQ